METVNIQLAVKGNIPSTPRVSMPSVDTFASKVKPESEVAGKILPSVNTKELEVSPKTQDEIEAVVSELNSFVQNIQRNIQFSVHEKTGHSIVTVSDRETGEEIRQFPSEQALAIAVHIAETLAVPGEIGLGLIVNGKA
jgi:flagellar protein FlaG